MANILANKPHMNGVTNNHTTAPLKTVFQCANNGKATVTPTNVSHPSDLYHVIDLILQDEDRAMEVSNDYMASLLLFLS